MRIKGKTNWESVGRIIKKNGKEGERKKTKKNSERQGRGRVGAVRVVKRFVFGDIKLARRSFVLLLPPLLLLLPLPLPILHTTTTTTDVGSAAAAVVVPGRWPWKID